MLTPYRKTVVAAVITLVSAIVAAVTGDQITTEELTMLVLEALTTIGVYVAPNAGPRP